MGTFSRYIPHTDDDIQSMLETIGVQRVEDIFKTIPSKYRLSTSMNLPEALGEPDLLSHLRKLQSPLCTSFLGGGAYHHFIPAVVPYLISRSEFYTAYTPYQPEISQGTLQSIFEYQTLMSELTGMEVSNGSLYDGASSLAEAVLMAFRVTKRKKVLLSEAIHPEYRKVIETYVDPDQQEIVLIPYREEDGQTDERALSDLLDETVNAVVIQSPNFFGVIENLRGIGEEVHQVGGMMIVGFSEAIAYGILAPPGAFEADIVAGEGQSLGIPLSFGGPYLGIFTTRNKHVRTMPGRLVGETVDLEGRRGFVLTLATREQHIRREKATSNICTNEGLCALMATIYLSCLGREGLKEVARMNLSKADYAKKAVSTLKGCSQKFTGATFNEFVLEIDGDPEKVLRDMKQEKIIGGLPLAKFYPKLNRHLLVTVTEMNSKEEIDRWAESLQKALR